MTNLSLSQQYALFVLQDKPKGKLSGSGDHGTGFIAGSVLELLLTGVLAFDEKQRLITTEKNLAANQSALKPLYQFIELKQPVKATKVADYYMSGLKNRISPLFKETINDLTEKNYVSSSSKETILGVTDYFNPSSEIMEALTKELNTTIETDSSWSEEQAVLIMLLKESGLLKKTVSKEHYRQAGQQLKIFKKEPHGKVITKMFDQVHSVMVAAIVASTSVS